MAVHLASLTSVALPRSGYRIVASPVISGPADAAEQRTEHVVRELLKPVNGKAEDALRLSALLALRPCCLRRMLRLPGWPGIGMTLEREAEDPISLFPITGHKSASEIAGHRLSLFIRRPHAQGTWAVTGDEEAQSLAASAWLPRARAAGARHARRHGRRVRGADGAEDQAGPGPGHGRRAVHRRGVRAVPARQQQGLRPGGHRDPAAGHGERAGQARSGR